MTCLVVSKDLTRTTSARVIYHIVILMAQDLYKNRVMSRLVMYISDRIDYITSVFGYNPVVDFCASLLAKINIRINADSHKSSLLGII